MPKAFRVISGERRSAARGGDPGVYHRDRIEYHFRFTEPGEQGMKIRKSVVWGFSITFAGAALAAAYPGHPATSPDITAADLSARDKALADDAFQGRWPGAPSGEAAAPWIADEMKRIG